MTDMGGGSGIDGVFGRSGPSVSDMRSRLAAIIRKGYHGRDEEIVCDICGRRQ